LNPRLCATLAALLAIFGALVARWPALILPGAAAFAALGAWLAARGDADAGDPELETDLGRLRGRLADRERKLARERGELAALIGALGDAIVAVDGQGNLRFCNSPFARRFGGDGPEWRAGRAGRGAGLPRLGELFRDPELLAAFRAALDDGCASAPSVRLPVRGEAARRHFTVAIAPLRTPGSGGGAIGVFHDVTELKRAETARIDFVANVSHELRTPLTAIKGYADTLRADLAENRLDSAPLCAESIARNAARLMELVRDLLDLSSLERGEEGGTPFRKSAVATRAVTERVLAQLEPRCRERGQRIEREFAATSVFADEHRLEQVLGNLLENAVKHCPPGARIRVRWEREPGVTLLRVADDGPGIPRADQPRVFERFYRVDRGRGRDSGGTGLGLAIVKHILIQHGGTASLVSEEGRGAEFICRFPE
jgi:two-component system phosphate regulon sensor histidine kinase PhoR